MPNTEINSALVTATKVRDAAAVKLADCAARVRKNDESNPLYEIYCDQMDEAFEALDVAQDALRLVRDGYAHTYPHPVASYPHGMRYPLGGRR
jgi:hypothetical protein